MKCTWANTTYKMHKQVASYANMVKLLMEAVSFVIVFVLFLFLFVFLLGVSFREVLI